MSDLIQPYLTKILQSSEFQNSTKYQKLLEYLVNSTLEGKVPKEITISIELFGVEMKDDTVGETNTRVYIHNVRKKLDSYYINEGKNDKIQFKIPKGRYKVEFVKRKDPRRLFERKIIIILASIIALLILVDIYVLRFNLKPSFNEVNGKYSSWIWKDFIDKDIPLAVIIGDYYLLKDVTFSDRSRFIRDVRINSESDFDNFLLDYPEYAKTYSRTRHTFMGKYATLCINKIGRIMNPAGQGMEIILASEFQWQNLKDFNLVYIGSFKSTGMLGQLTNNSSFQFNLYPNNLQFTDLETDSVYQYFPIGSDIFNSYETDYCVVTKLPGSGQQDVLMFLSVRDIGLIETMEYFTDPETLNSFEQLLHEDNQDTKYFEACFKIQGMDRNSMSIDLLHINHLPASSIFELDPLTVENP